MLMALSRVGVAAAASMAGDTGSFAVAH